MKSGELLDLCLALPGAEDTDPWEAREWYDRYPDHVSTTEYIGRHGWITVRHDDGAVPDDELEELVDISYTAVVAKLPERLRPEA